MPLFPKYLFNEILERESSSFFLIKLIMTNAWELINQKVHNFVLKNTTILLNRMIFLQSKNGTKPEATPTQMVRHTVTTCYPVTRTKSIVQGQCNSIHFEQMRNHKKKYATCFVWHSTGRKNLGQAKVLRDRSRNVKSCSFSIKTTPSIYF